MRAKKDRVRLRICWRTAASEHGRSYAITLHLTTNVSATQGLSRKRVERRAYLVWSIVRAERFSEPLFVSNIRDKPNKPKFTGLLVIADVRGRGGW